MRQFLIFELLARAQRGHSEKTYAKQRQPGSKKLASAIALSKGAARRALSSSTKLILGRLLPQTLRKWAQRHPMPMLSRPTIRATKQAYQGQQEH
jgi:hypothetical protein